MLTMTMHIAQLEEALRRTGQRLARDGAKERIRLYLVGGAAGLLSGWLSETRATGDVDVVETEPVASWDRVCRAAAAVARELELPESWLNNRCSIYAWCLPLGWKTRCESVRTHGPLEIIRITRRDFISAKVVSAPDRPQDLEDLIAIGPGPEELDFTDEHLDRLERKSLDPFRSFEDARTILRTLRRAS